MNMQFFRRFGFAAALVVGASLAGCGGGPKYVPVSGVVTRGGKPLANVRVEFWPEGNAVKSTAITDAEGHYNLMVEDGKSVGAVVGSHRVILKDMNMFGEKFLGRKAENMPDISGGKKPRFAKQFSDPAATTVKKTVTDSAINTIDIEVP